MDSDVSCCLTIKVPWCLEPKGRKNNTPLVPEDKKNNNRLVVKVYKTNSVLVIGPRDLKTFGILVPGARRQHIYHFLWCQRAIKPSLSLPEG